MSPDPMLTKLADLIAHDHIQMLRVHASDQGDAPIAASDEGYEFLKEYGLTDANLREHDEFPHTPALDAHPHVFAYHSVFEHLEKAVADQPGLNDKSTMVRGALYNAHPLIVPQESFSRIAGLARAAAHEGKPVGDALNHEAHHFTHIEGQPTEDKLDTVLKLLANKDFKNIMYGVYPDRFTGVAATKDGAEFLDGIGMKPVKNFASKQQSHRLGENKKIFSHEELFQFVIKESEGNDKKRAEVLVALNNAERIPEPHQSAVDGLFTKQAQNFML